MTLTPRALVRRRHGRLRTNRSRGRGDAKRLRDARPAAADRLDATASTPSRRRCRWAMGDFDSEVVLRAAGRLRKRAILFTCRPQASAAGNRDQRGDVRRTRRLGNPAALACRLRIRDPCGREGPGGEPQGFAAGFDAAGGSAPGETGTPGKRKRPERSERVRQTFRKRLAPCSKGAPRACSGFRTGGLTRALPRPPRGDRESRGPRRRRIQLQTKRGVLSPCGMCYGTVIRVADSETRRRPASNACAREVRAKPPRAGAHRRVPQAGRWTSSPQCYRAFLARTAPPEPSGFRATKPTSACTSRRDQRSARFFPLRLLAWLRPSGVTPRAGTKEQALIGRWPGRDRGAAKRDADLALRNSAVRQG